MPVTATPVGDAGCPAIPGTPTNPVTAPPASVDCDTLDTVQAGREQEPVTGVSLPMRSPAYEVPAGLEGRLRIVFRRSDGAPVDLSGCLCEDSSSSSSDADAECPCPVALRFKTREAMGKGLVNTDYTVEVVDAAAGEVDVVLTADDTAAPGIYRGELAMVECRAAPEPEPVLASMALFLTVRDALWSAGCAGPPSMQEIRLWLRDSSVEESRLLSAVKFSPAEIAIATQMPVQYWNETPPPVKTFNTASFPYRAHWLTGIAGYLFRIAAEQQRANYLQYTAGGISVNDQAKEMSYEQAAERRLAEYRDFVRRKKLELNMDAGFGYVSSPYAGRYRW